MQIEPPMLAGRPSRLGEKDDFVSGVDLYDFSAFIVQTEYNVVISRLWRDYLWFINRVLAAFRAFDKHASARDAHLRACEPQCLGSHNIPPLRIGTHRFLYEVFFLKILQK